MAASDNESKEIKILVNSLSDRTLPNSFRKQVNSYFDTQKEHDPSFYWELLLYSIRYSLMECSELLNNPKIKDRAMQLAQQLEQNTNNAANNEQVDSATIVKNIVALWETEEFQSDFNAAWHPEKLRSKYFLKTFVPLAKDLLNSKRDFVEEDVMDLSTSLTGIVEDRHAYGNNNVTTVLLGGRRNERKKWVHAFDNVSATLLFIPADTFLIEDSTGYIEGRQSAFTLYRDISHSKFLSETPVILFISRINLLEDAIKSGADIKQYLPSDYSGDIDARSIVLHFIDKFCELRNPAKPFFAVCGDIVDRHAMKLIIPFILQTLILSENSTKKLSNVIVDPERNLFVYYPTKLSSTFVTEIRAVVKTVEPSKLSLMLQVEQDSELINTCKSLINNELHADLKLQVGQSVLHAHSLILQARVPELFTLWTDNGLTKEIAVKDLDYQSTQLLLEYIYTDSIDLLENGDSSAVPSLLALLKFADKFALPSLMQYLCRGIADKMHLAKGTKAPPMDIHLVQELLQLGETAHSDDLQLKCIEYLLFLEEDNKPVKLSKEKKPKKRTGCVIS